MYRTILFLGFHLCVFENWFGLFFSVLFNSFYLIWVPSILSEHRGKSIIMGHTMIDFYSVWFSFPRRNMLFVRVLYIKMNNFIIVAVVIKVFFFLGNLATEQSGMLMVVKLSIIILNRCLFINNKLSNLSNGSRRSYIRFQSTI